MAFTNQQVADWLASNPGLSDAQIAAAMAQFGVSPEQMSAVTGIPVQQVVSRMTAAAPAATVTPKASTSPLATIANAASSEPTKTVSKKTTTPVTTAAAQPTASSFSNKQVSDWLASNPGLSDAQIASAMKQFGVSAAQMAQVTGIPVQQVTARMVNPSTVAPLTKAASKTSTAAKPAAVSPLAAIAGSAKAATTPAVTAPAPVAPAPKFSNAAFGDWLASNPNFTDAQIASAMSKYGVSPAEMAKVTGVPEGQIAARVAKTLEPGQNLLLGDTWVQPIYNSTGQGETFEQGPLSQVLVYKQGQTTGDPYAKYSPSGESEGTGQFKESGGPLQLLKEMGREVGPIALAALTAGGAGGLIGGALAPTASLATQGAIGGALLGGGGAALTGGNVLKGAAMGGLGGYFSGAGAGTDPMQAAMDADIAGGMVPEFGTNAAYDTFMQSAMTPAARAAIEAQIANSSVAGFTPDEILAQGNLITDLASGNAMGPQTAEQLGQGFQDYMAESGYTPVTSTTQPATQQTTATTAPTTTGVAKPAGALAAAGDKILGIDKDTLKLAATALPLLPAAASVLGLNKPATTTAAPAASAAPVDSRGLAQWDWDRIAADAAKANLGVNSFVARNWNLFNQGAYNKPGAYFSSASTPSTATATPAATADTATNAPITQGYARGGSTGVRSSPLSRVSYLAKGGGSGRDDLIPAKLSDGEYVMDAETVALLGDGSTDEGSRRLDSMRAKIRQHKGKSMARGKFSANAKSPLAYLKEST